MTTKILDSVGTLQLIDTGKRCSVRNVRILRVHCTAGCGSDDLLHDGIVDAYWRTMQMINGYHQGCDPNSVWRKDPVGSKLQHDATRSLLDKHPSGACFACDQFDCTGAVRSGKETA
jgi:hypothetical protein